ncbi:MAG: 50S ribosomal protein L11 methyltransferase [Pedobacter sp.]|nr:50S ribosomal protein L11 methyltransferase [Pedobacter sp.]MDQ8052339.1 50S ribosomal protein L11 methyltransferase [Pedobacter sp.]
MEYIKVAFVFEQIEEYQQDILIAELADMGFDTFEPTEQGFDAFIVADGFDEAELKAIMAGAASDLNGKYEIFPIEAQNWNEEWEKNFSPLIISDNCYIRATFHEPQPQYEYEIVIDPKMAFGTGHHQTTTMMMRYLLQADLNHKTVLDMGAGTGILGILAAKRGAKSITAIDNDDVCYRSAIENAALNQVENLTSLCGSKEMIPNAIFDVILANINRNILLDQMESYAAVLAQGGTIFFSGFYETPDLEMIRAAASKFDLHYIDHQKIDNWVAARFEKR